MTTVKVFLADDSQNRIDAFQRLDDVTVDNLKFELVRDPRFDCDPDAWFQKFLGCIDEPSILFLDLDLGNPGLKLINNDILAKYLVDPRVSAVNGPFRVAVSIGLNRLQDGTNQPFVLVICSDHAAPRARDPFINFFEKTELFDMHSQRHRFGPLANGFQSQHRHLQYHWHETAKRAYHSRAPLAEYNDATERSAFLSTLTLYLYLYGSSVDFWTAFGAHEWSTLRSKLWESFTEWSASGIFRRLRHQYWAHHLSGGGAAEERLPIWELFKKFTAIAQSVIPFSPVGMDALQLWWPHHVPDTLLQANTAPPWRSVCQFDQGLGNIVDGKMGGRDLLRVIEGLAFIKLDRVVVTVSAEINDLYGNCFWFNAVLATNQVALLCRSLNDECGRQSTSAEVHVDANLVRGVDRRGYLTLTMGQKLLNGSRMDFHDNVKGEVRGAYDELQRAGGRVQVTADGRLMAIFAANIAEIVDASGNEQEQWSLDLTYSET